MILKEGRSPYIQWLNSLSPYERARVLRFIERLAESGSKQNIRALKEGLFELKVPFGPGYRVYFGFEGIKTIVLLNGGTKKTQKRDIKRARRLWSKYVSDN